MRYVIPLLLAGLLTSFGCSEKSELKKESNSWESGQAVSREFPLVEFDGAGARAVFSIGDTRISIATPDGFAVLENEAADFRQRINSTKPPQNDVHVVFVQQVDLASILDGKNPDISRHLSIQSDRRAAEAKISSATFQAVK